MSGRSFTRPNTTVQTSYSCFLIYSLHQYLLTQELNSPMFSVLISLKVHKMPMFHNCTFKIPIYSFVNYFIHFYKTIEITSHMVPHCKEMSTYAVAAGDTGDNVSRWCCAISSHSFDWLFDAKVTKSAGIFTHTHCTAQKLQTGVTWKINTSLIFEYSCWIAGFWFGWFPFAFKNDENKWLIIICTHIIWWCRPMKCL